jgi:hypothetical protein
MSDAIAAALATLQGDFRKLGARIRTLEHTVPCACSKATIRVHYPALRDGKATIQDLVGLIAQYLTKFALPRTRMSEINAKYGVVSAEEFADLLRGAEKEARKLFIRANKATNRNGEAGELLLYLLTEWILEAPQVLAKMPLKTSSQVAVHGPDGVHVKYSTESKSLMFFWGESKLHADISAGITSAAKSIASALGDDKLEHEFNLISRNINFTGLSDEAKAALLSYLDPNDERSSDRINITTCLIGFDLEAYRQLPSMDAGKIEENLQAEILKILPSIADKFGERTAENGIVDERFELFLFPIPSVQEFRDLFQAEIGWSS